MLLPDPHFGFHRHAGTKLSSPCLVGFKAEPHGNSLHDFHIVAGGVFRRQNTGDGAGAAADIFHIAFENPVSARRCATPLSGPAEILPIAFL